MIIIIAFGAIAAFIPFLIRKIQADRRRILLASQLRQALQNMVHALRIGVLSAGARIRGPRRGNAAGRGMAPVPAIRKPWYFLDGVSLGIGPAREHL